MFGDMRSARIKIQLVPFGPQGVGVVLCSCVCARGVAPDIACEATQHQHASTFAVFCAFFVKYLPELQNFGCVSYGIETTTHDKCIACAACPQHIFVVRFTSERVRSRDQNDFACPCFEFHRAALWSIQPRTPSHFERESHHCEVVFRRRSLSVVSIMFRAV